MDRYRARNKKETSFKPGHKKTAGRKPGVPNKITMTVKEAILEAVQRYGSDGKGKDGLIGYFLRMCNDEALMCRLIEKIMPTQITGKDGGAIQVLSLPPELLKGLSTEELTLLEQVLAKIGSGRVSDTPTKIGNGDASKYAAAIGDTGATRH